jgi:hypothetical protein
MLMTTKHRSIMSPVRFELLTCAVEERPEPPPEATARIAPTTTKPSRNVRPRIPPADVGGVTEGPLAGAVIAGTRLVAIAARSEDGHSLLGCVNRVGSGLGPPGEVR